ncbi:hypothetical protein BCR26_03145 [Enterococcus rivorum]|uniref:Glycosyltransferase 2-like domain-containing protein n=3 Tax=Enterococcus rivorum TaxID=762845 RepID=A0A1E5KX64_9ENTE|nr:hypothetical protein BCR26_03145 [Enterococcus rivorum]
MKCTSYKELYKKMNLTTDAFIVNQSDNDLGTIKEKIKESVLKGMTFCEKGVGLSRNMALMRANGDICLMADDDMVYVDSYESIVKRAYSNYPDADMIVFNVRIHQNGKTIEKVKKNGRVHLWNALKYGTVCFSFRRKNVLEQRVSFSLLFGGGTGNGSGEDTLFITDVLRSGLKVYSVQDVIADVYNDGSTWFNGYNEKYFEDKGTLFKALFPKLYFFPILRFTFKYRNLYEEDMSAFKALSCMIFGKKV